MIAVYATATSVNRCANRQVKRKVKRLENAGKELEGILEAFDISVDLAIGAPADTSYLLVWVASSSTTRTLKGEDSVSQSRGDPPPRTFHKVKESSSKGDGRRYCFCIDTAGATCRSTARVTRTSLVSA
jgi:hypothetical protein